MLQKLNTDEPEHESSVSYDKMIVLTPDCCRKALKRMPTISGPGRSGLRASHLRTILSPSVDERTFASFLKYLTVRHQAGCATAALSPLLNQTGA